MNTSSQDMDAIAPGVDLQSFLKQFSGQTIFYCANPGNGGDSIIAAATYQHFRRAKIKYKLIRHNQLNLDLSNKVVFYGGGGNLAHKYGHCSRFFHTYHRDVKRIVLLPHTVTGRKDLLKDLGDNVDIIARERASFEHLQTHACGGARIHLMHDIGISLDLAELRACWPSIRGTMVRDLGKLGRQWLRQILLRLPAGSTLNCFRCDIEKTDREIPNDNIDLPEYYKAGTAPEFIANLTASLILRTLEKYEVINTNRLHMAIGGMILGKVVNFEDNSYGKNRWVYDFSIKNRYTNLHWK